MKHSLLKTNCKLPAFCLAVFAFFVFVFLPQPTLAAPTACTWTGGAGTTTWATAGNWSCGSAPTTDSYAVTIPAGMTYWPNTGTARTIGDLTVDSGAEITLGGILTVQDNSGVGTTGSATINGTIHHATYTLRTHGDLTLNGTSDSTGALTLYADYDFSGAGTFTMGASGVVAGGAGAVAIDGVGTQVLNTISNSGAYSITINANRRPSSVTINGVISNSNTASKVFSIYSNGNITQNADIGTAGFPFGSVSLYFDQDNTGDSINFNSASTIYSGPSYNIYFFGNSNTTFTYTSANFSSGSNLYIGYSAGNKFGNVIIAGSINISGGVNIYSNGSITQNTDVSIASSGAISIYADHDANGTDAFTMNSGSSITAGSGQTITIDASGVMTLNTITNSGAADITIGNNRKPSSVIINGVISNSNTVSRTLTIYSNGDITQNADLGLSSYNLGIVYLYFDQDNTGDSINYNSTSTVYINSSLRFYGKANATFTYTSATISGGALYIGSTTAGTKFGTVVIAGSPSSRTDINFYSDGSITQNANQTISSSNGVVYIYADHDANGIDAFTMNSGSSITAGSGSGINIDASGVMTLNTITNSGAANITIGANRIPSSVIINGVISNSNTASRTLTIYSNGDIVQNANIGTESFPFGNVLFLYDRDNTGDSINFNSVNTTYVDSLFSLRGSSNSTLTYTSATVLGVGTFQISYVSASTRFGSVVIAGSLNVTGNVAIYSDGSITQNTNQAITSSGTVTIYADYDNNGIGDFTMNSGTSITAGSAKAIAIDASGVVTLNTITNSGAADITIGANRKPSSVIINGVISNSTVSTQVLNIYSNSDITQNANIGFSSYKFVTVNLYFDQDNTGDSISYPNGTGTIYSSINLYLRGKSNTTITVNSANNASGALRVGTTTTGEKFGMITIAGNINILGGFYIYSDGDIIQNAGLAIITNGGGVVIYADHDANGTGVFTMNSEASITVLSSGYSINIDSTGDMVLGSLTATGTTNITIGANRKPSSVTINGVISNSNTAGRTLTINSNGDINQQANLGTASFPFGTITLYPNQSLGSYKTYITDNSTVNCTTYTVTGNLVINPTKTLTSNCTTINVSNNWDNQGTFIPGTSTVNLNGTNQKLFGSTNFYKLTKDISSTNADTLYFQQSTTQSILSSGTLTLKGASGKVLTLRGCDAVGIETSGNPKWSLNVSNTSTTFAVDYINVKDSDAS